MSDFRESQHPRGEGGKWTEHQGAAQPGNLADVNVPGTDVAVSAASPAHGVTDSEGHTYELRGDRIVRDGTHAAVLLSGGFGAGYSSWNEDASPFEPAVVAAVLAGRNDLLTAGSLREHLGITGSDDVIEHGARDLSVEWVRLGTRFKIEEYDGSEYLITENDLNRTA